MAGAWWSRTLCITARVCLVGLVVGGWTACIDYTLGADRPPCGDGHLGGSEECDDGEDNSSSLPDHCRETCELPWCGDGVVDSGEECELLAEHRLQCSDLGFDRGWLGCRPHCGFYTSECSLCGDNHASGLDPSALEYEGCDGDDLRGRGCDTLGRGGGNLGCTDICTLDLSGCDDTQPVCGNGLAEEDEECDDGDVVSGDGCSATCRRERPSWSQLPSEGLPCGRLVDYCRLFFHAQRRELVALQWSTELVTHDGVAWRVVDDGGIPGFRFGGSAAFDSVRGVLVVFGGALWNIDFEDDTPPTIPQNDTWEWDAVAWTRLTGTVRPSPRQGAAMAYDPRREEVVLFGGGEDDSANSETWRLRDGEWTEVSTDASPPARRAAALAYDVARDRMVLYSGVSPNGEPLTDTWEFDGAAWSERFLPLSPPPVTYDLMPGSMTYDALRERVIYQTRIFPDWADRWSWQLWEFDGHRWREVTRLTAGVPASALCMSYHPGMQAPVFADPEGGLWFLQWR